MVSESNFTLLNYFYLWFVVKLNTDDEGLDLEIDGSESDDPMATCAYNFEPSIDSSVPSKDIFVVKVNNVCGKQCNVFYNLQAGLEVLNPVEAILVIKCSWTDVVYMLGLTEVW